MADLIRDVRPKSKKTTPPPTTFADAPKPQITMPPTPKPSPVPKQNTPKPTPSNIYTPTPRTSPTPIDGPSTPAFQTDTATATVPIKTPIVTAKPTPYPKFTGPAVSPKPKPTTFTAWFIWPYL